MSLGNVIDEIQRLEHFRILTCSGCQSSLRYHTLQIYVHCLKCGTEHKVRGFGARGTEIQDVIDAVLDWAGDGENFESVLKRHSEIQLDQDE